MREKPLDRNRSRAQHGVDERRRLLLRLPRVGAGRRRPEQRVPLVRRPLLQRSGTLLRSGHRGGSRGRGSRRRRRLPRGHAGRHRRRGRSVRSPQRVLPAQLLGLRLEHARQQRAQRSPVRRRPEGDAAQEPLHRRQRARHRLQAGARRLHQRARTGEEVQRRHVHAELLAPRQPQGRRRRGQDSSALFVGLVVHHVRVIAVAAQRPPVQPRERRRVVRRRELHEEPAHGGRRLRGRVRDALEGRGGGRGGVGSARALGHRVAVRGRQPVVREPFVLAFGGAAQREQRGGVRQADGRREKRDDHVRGCGACAGADVARLPQHPAQADDGRAKRSRLVQQGSRPCAAAAPRAEAAEVRAGCGGVGRAHNGGAQDAAGVGLVGGPGDRLLEKRIGLGPEARRRAAAGVRAAQRSRRTGGGGGEPVEQPGAAGRRPGQVDEGGDVQGHVEVGEAEVERG